ncbi:hypothetical protein ALC57_03464 [Trachymyrmex cornetzi]|uniref:Uncharacterized protein n=1 Tax=Trachymyrmex cornetzi TaxID=471704 RepID=A0A195EG28_9HYME|nr:hypothetical protein ALC57_03464 [Trachymyrmex cornetzi]
MRCAIFLRTNFIEEVRRRAGEEGREEGREVLNSSVRIVDKIYEAGGYGLSGPCTSESGHRLDSGSPFWRIQLDQDLLDTISAIYPEWFKDYTNSRAASTSSPTSASASGAQSCNDSAAVVVVTGGEHKVAKSDAKSKSKAKKADGHKDKDRDRKDPRRDAKDERDAGNGKKGTKPSPQQDKAAADAAGRKAVASAVPGSESKMAEGNQSPPKAEVDDSPLQHAMDRNKEYDMSMKINGSDKNHLDTLCTLSSVCRHSLFLSPPPSVVETEASLFDRPTATENIDVARDTCEVTLNVHLSIVRKKVGRIKEDVDNKFVRHAVELTIDKAVIPLGSRYFTKKPASHRSCPPVCLSAMLLYTLSRLFSYSSSLLSTPPREFP